MKLFFFLFVFSFNVFAQDDKDKLFQEHKQNFSNHIDERITQLNKAKACVGSSANPEEMQKCRQEMKEGMKKIKADFKEERKDMKGKREELRDSKRKEMQGKRDELREAKRKQKSQ